MTQTPIPSAGDLRGRLLARLEDIRHALDQAAVVESLSTAQRAEFRRLRAALDMLERRVREILEE